MRSLVINVDRHIWTIYHVGLAEHVTDLVEHFDKLHKFRTTFYRHEQLCTAK
jgi:hypothetical protein